MPQHDREIVKRAYTNQEVIIPKPKTPKQRASLEEILVAVSDSGGNITTVAKRLGLDRSTVSKYGKNIPEVAEALHRERESRKDFAEDMLFSQVEGGNIISTLFFLKTQAKDRGYVEAATDVEYVVKTELRRFLMHMQERLEPDIFEAVVDAVREFKTVEGRVVAGSDL